MTADVLCVTLARGGSKGVPGKHLRMLAGKPVLQWTFEAVAKSKYSENYAFSSDDTHLLSFAQYCGVFCIRRPKELALDTTPTLPALIHAVDYYERYVAHKEYQYIVEIRATSPLKTSLDIDGAVDLLISSGADSVIGVTPLEDHHPARIKWLDASGRIRDFLPEPESGRRQDCQPKAYIRNGTIYALRRDALMGEGGKLFGHEHSLGYIMPEDRSVNIDTELDLLTCELLLNTERKTND